MRSKNYTVMFIPEDETNARSHHLSKKSFFLAISSLVLLVASSIIIMVYFIPKIVDYHRIKDQHDQFVSERMKVLSLTRDLERIRQMDELVRTSLGATLDLEPRPEILDSSSGMFHVSDRPVSYIENIPSVVPINGYVSQRSDNPGLFIKAAHNGIDIVAKEGSPIMASASGVVVFSGWTYESGNMIILYHGDDYFTHYGHNKENLKGQLDIVERGEVIALVGSTGISSGPHLHFEVWREFIPLDPFIFFPEYNESDLTLTNE